MYRCLLYEKKISKRVKMCIKFPEFYANFRSERRFCLMYCKKIIPKTGFSAKILNLQKKRFLGLTSLGTLIPIFL